MCGVQTTFGSATSGRAGSVNGSNLRPLPDQDQHFSVLEPLGEHIHVLDVVVPDRDVEGCQLGEARQRVQRVEVVVED
jgi:hypothetical protein